MAQEVPATSFAGAELLVGGVTVTSLAGHWVGYLPGIITALGGLVGFIYYILQIWHDESVQGRVRMWRQRRIEKYKAKIAKLEEHV